MTQSRAVRTNGGVGTVTEHHPIVKTRFSYIPAAIDISVSGLDDNDTVEVDLEELPDDPTELCTLLENEGAAKSYWVMVALAYAKQRKADHAIEMLIKGLAVTAKAAPKDKLSMLTCMAWLYLWKSREAPRIIPEGALASEARTKDFYLQAATATLNEASRINPAFPPLSLARGVLYLRRASLHAPSSGSMAGSSDASDRVETVRQAIRCFEDASRASGGRNVFAILGKARAQFSLGKYPQALEGYQQVVARMPSMIDPDPRLGIGCCLWHLGFKKDAKAAWERALELNPDSPLANILLANYHLDSTSGLPTNDPKFISSYKKAMQVYTQRAFKLDSKLPLTCATFGAYFLSRKAMETVEKLSRSAIALTDVNAVASDGWYLLARKAHFEDDLARAGEYYRKADEARGGGDKGFLPAKFGLAQVQVLNNDLDGAKFRLEKIVQQSKNIEAMMLLGALYAEEVFASQNGPLKEDKSAEIKKAIGLLETVRLAWKDPKKGVSPEPTVLLNLARLYETDAPEKSLACLRQVEELEIAQIPTEDRPPQVEDEGAFMAALRSHLPPPLLNNIGCFLHQSGKYDEAREMFQTALGACIEVTKKDPDAQTDSPVTTISYNLARTYESAGLLDEAKKIYEGLLKRHDDYVAAHTRLAYIALRQTPTDEGPKLISKLMQSEPGDLEVRALYGWFLSKSKRRSTNISEDPEHRHHKHTLQHFDKHDRYALTGMGNIHLTNAREMRRETESEKEKRRKTYERAVEFFDKALLLDPKNAYAAQGIGIALAEDRKDYNAAVMVFNRVKETIRDASVSINLGHVHAELKNYARAIENYEAAMAKDRGKDPQILACLGRVWLQKGKQEKSAQAMKQSLALAIAPDQVHFQFNVAFVQIQVAQLLYTLPETQRTLEEVQAAANGLDEAIEAFVQVAASKNPPYPRHDLELRADMGRNTMRRQLERATASQREFEEKNAEKLKVARELRDAQQKQREVEKQREAERLLEQKRKIAEERQKMLEKDREITAKREEEEKVKHELEFTTDSETGERTKKRTKRGGQKKREAGSDGEATDKKKSRKRRSGSAAATTDEESAAPKKRRRLQQREAVNKGNKYKSSEIVVESDSDENGAAGSIADKDVEEADDRKEPTKDDRPSDRDHDDDEDEDEDEDIQRSRSARKKNARRALDSDDEDDEAEEDIAAPTSPVKNTADEDLQSTHENGKDAESPSQDEDVAMGDAAPDEPTNEEADDDDDGA